MKKRILGILLMLTLVLALVPLTALNAEAASTDPIYVAGVKMTDGTYLANGASSTRTSKPSGGYAYYKDGVLTLSSFDNKGSYYTYGYDNVAIVADGDLTLKLVGTSYINGGLNYGVASAEGTLTIKGSGTLEVDATYYHSLYGYAGVVISGGTINVDGGGTSGVYSYAGNITVSGGSVTVTDNSYGLYTYQGGITIKDGTTKLDTLYDSIASEGDVTISGGTVTMNSGENCIYASTGDVTISGGTVTMNSGWDGIYAYEGKLTIKGGTVKVTAGDDGLQADYGNLVISGGKLTVNADACGFWAYDGTVTISKGTVKVTAGSTGIGASNKNITIKGGTITVNSYASGISSSTGSVTISGGTVKVTTEDASGINSYGADITVSGGTVTVDAGEDGFYAWNNITLSGGTVSVDAESYCMYAYQGDVTVNGGVITLDAGEFGIDANLGNVTIADGTVTVEADGVGIFTDGGDITISGGKVTVVSEYVGVWTYSGNISFMGGHVAVQASDEGARAIYTGSPVSSANGLTFKASVDPAGAAMEDYNPDNLSNYHLLIVTPGPTISEQPVSVVVGSGETAKAGVSADGFGLTYKWYYKNKGSSKFTLTNTFKSNSYSVSMTSSRNGRQIYCVITDQFGNSVKTDTVTLKMGNTVKITKQPTNAAAPKGGTATVKFTATGDGLTYKWYYKNKGASSFSRTTTFKGNTYTAEMNSTRNGRQVYCVITDKYGNSVKTDVVTVYMGNPAKITKQPASASVANGKTATVKLTASGDGLTYQWYYKDKGSSKFTLTKTFTGNTYTAQMTASRNGRQIYCVITDKYGTSVKTDTVTITMSNGVKITKQPTSVTVASGSKATVKFTATGDGLTYTWYYKNKGDSSFTKTTSYTSNTYTVNMSSARDGRQVYCVVKDKYGNTVKTDVVTLKMK